MNETRSPVILGYILEEPGLTVFVEKQYSDELDNSHPTRFRFESNRSSNNTNRIKASKREICRINSDDPLVPRARYTLDQAPLEAHMISSSIAASPLVAGAAGAAALVPVSK